MFTPEGYWSWHDTVRAASDWTLEIVATTLAPEVTVDQLDSAPHKCKEIIYEKLITTKRVETLSEARFSFDLLELWVLANFMDTYEAVLCSPTGRTLRCPPLISAHGDAFDWWVWPLSNEKMSDGEASGYFKAFQANIFHIGHARQRFCAIDYETGDIRLKANTVHLLASASYGHSETKEGTLRFIDEQIRPIVGWSICWNPEEIPETRFELFEALGFGDLDFAKKRERDTSSGVHILECTLAAFPDGKGNVTWSNVEAKVGYSRRSIVRALRRNGLYSKWAKHGQR
jgi:hypothetical protein